jgi:hypothetical protein
LFGPGIAELATLLERERAKVPPHAKLLVTLNGDFLSGSQVGEIHKGYVESNGALRFLPRSHFESLMT